MTVYNRSANACASFKNQGAKLASSPREAAHGAEIIISMVTDDAASRQLWLDAKNGALAGAEKGAIAIESSTLTPGWVTTLAAHAAAAGLDFIDAPVAGSRPQAEAGQLIYLVGGEQTTLDRARPVLMAMGTAIHHAGGIGSGSTLKLAVNTLFGIQVAALAETLQWLEKSGIMQVDAVNILNALPTSSPALQGIGKLMAAGNDAPLFPIALVAKDFAYATEFAQAQRAACPVAETVAQLYHEAKNAGLGDKNIVAVRHCYGRLTS